LQSNSFIFKNINFKIKRSQEKSFQEFETNYQKINMDIDELSKKLSLIFNTEISASIKDFEIFKAKVFFNNLLVL
jgi:hypothetical protein